MWPGHFWHSKSINAIASQAVFLLKSTNILGLSVEKPVELTWVSVTCICLFVCLRVTSQVSLPAIGKPLVPKTSPIFPRKRLQVVNKTSGAGSDRAREQLWLADGPKVKRGEERDIFL